MKQVKIGRNSPCPCGSGKRYKKCHGERKFNGILKQQVDRVKQLAYAGNIGRKREQFCIDMEAVMLELQKEAAEQFHQAQIRFRRGIKCGPGCSSCCSQFISTTLHEGEVIVRYLYQHPELLDIFMEQAYQWRERTKGENSFIAADRLQWNAEYFVPAREECRRLGIPCPFLYDNRCIIYPVRPMTCVCIASFEHPDQCSSKSKSPPIYWILDILYKHYPPYYAGDENGFTLLNAPILVVNLLLQGYRFIVQKLEGFEDVKQQVLADPALKNFFKSLPDGIYSAY